MKKIKKGMTLLEVVIALGIIGIMLVPLANGMLTSVRANKKAEDTQAAKLLGQQVVEKLKIEDRIDGNVNLDFHGSQLNIKPSVVNTDGKKEYPIVSANEVNGMTINGKIIEEEGVVSVNDISYENNTKLNKKVGLYIELDRNTNGDIVISLLEGNSRLNKLQEMIESSIPSKKVITVVRDTLDLKISVAKEGIVKVESIDPQIIYSTVHRLDGAIVIYAKDIETLNAGGQTINIEIENLNKNKFEEVQILRGTGIELSKWENGLKVKCSARLNEFKNVLYDEKNKRRGLYTVDLKVMKNNKSVEETKTQFYLGE